MYTASLVLCDLVALCAAAPARDTALALDTTTAAVDLAIDQPEIHGGITITKRIENYFAPTNIEFWV
jgi:hypothetical protein